MKGAFPTMITPYTADEAVDYETARKYVHWYYEKGCTGIFSVCQSSEIYYLSLEEREKLNRAVYDEAQAINRVNTRKLTVISSGHISDDFDTEVTELNRIYDSGTDALILITNHLDPDNMGDDVWIRNAEKLLRQLPADIPLGLYECPAPYKRLVTPRILEWCNETERFMYMKDTCCDADLMAKRSQILKNGSMKLYNANCQTLLESLRNGAEGYCGIMANFHPELYVWLCENYEKDPDKAEKLQGLIGTFGFTEGGLPYPLTAKYHMSLSGIPTVNFARNRNAGELTPYVRSCVEQMKRTTDFAKELLYSASKA